jgi:uncharacterized protein
MLQPAAIDGLAFARNAAVLGGRLALESLPRLAQSGCSASVLDFVLSGEINERGKPGLRLKVDGNVRLQCQRCLGDLDLPLHLEAQLEFAASEAEITALVEDEVLLALPMVPKHEHCSAAAESGADAGHRAFQALAALKK